MSIKFLLCNILLGLEKCKKLCALWSRWIGLSYSVYNRRQGRQSLGLGVAIPRFWAGGRGRVVKYYCLIIYKKYVQEVVTFEEK